MTAPAHPERAAQLLGALAAYRPARQAFLATLGLPASNRDPFAEFSEQLGAVPWDAGRKCLSRGRSASRSHGFPEHLRRINCRSVVVPGVDEFDVRVHEILRVTGCEASRVAATNRRDLSVCRADGEATALAAYDDLSEVTRSLVIEGKNPAGEVLLECAAYPVGEVGLASSCWQACNAVPQFGGRHGGQVDVTDGLRVDPRHDHGISARVHQLRDDIRIQDDHVGNSAG